MAIAAIRINAQPAGSDDDVPINALVSLSNNDNTGVTSWAWTLVDRPEGSAVTMGTPSSSTASFTPDVEGSYSVRLVVNAALSTEDTDAVIVGVREVKTLVRTPAAGETTEVDATDGWKPTVNNVLRLASNTAADGNLVVGVANVTLNTGDILYVATRGTLKSGLPGQERVPRYGKALATSADDMPGLLAIMVRDVATGGGTSSAGDTVCARTRGYIELALTLTGNAPVYVSDTGVLSSTPGTASRSVGRCVYSSGGVSGIWFDGGASGAGASSSAYAVKTANYTLSANDGVIRGNTVGGTFAIDLDSTPSPVPATNQRFTVFVDSAGAGPDQLVNALSITSDGAPALTLDHQYQAVDLLWTGTAWQLVRLFTLPEPRITPGVAGLYETNETSGTKLLIGALPYRKADNQHRTIILIEGVLSTETGGNAFLTFERVNTTSARTPVEDVGSGAVDYLTTAQTYFTSALGSANIAGGVTGFDPSQTEQVLLVFLHTDDGAKMASCAGCWLKCY